MQRPYVKSAIIGWLVVAMTTLLSGCGAMRIAYDRAPDLIYWWVDGYVDFDDVQSERATVELDRFFAWHRRTQLPDYARLLSQIQPQLAAPEPLTAAQMCRWLDEASTRVPPLLDRALPVVAEMAMTLTPAQLRHIERKYEKTNANYRDDYLQPDPDDRLDEATERVVDRAESLYGSLDAPQKALVRRLVAASPFDPELWFTERKLRQKELLATLRQLLADTAPRDRTEAALRTLVARMQVSPREAYTQYQQRLRAYNCELAAQLHNATNRDQRQKASERVKGWAEDFRVLSAANR